MADSDKVFTGSIPKIYEQYLVPLIFDQYADDLRQRLGASLPARNGLAEVLEVAAGTGVVTRTLATMEGISLLATDLNQAMLDEAATVGTARPVRWQQADAMDLPFDDATYDAVICQFGVMFFPDKSKAFAEIHRVLKPGGLLLFNVWDRLSENAFADTVDAGLQALFPDDAPRFLARTPYGYHDAATIKQDLAAGGFSHPPEIDTVRFQSRASSAQVPAIAYCQGTPLRNEIEARQRYSVAEATEAAAAAIAQRFGASAVEGGIQALVVSQRK